MDNRDLTALVLIVSLLQVVHCFEEIGMDVFEVYRKRAPKNPRGVYLRTASVLVGLNFIIAILVLYDVPFAPWLCLYTVDVSVMNCVVHLIGYMKTKSFRATTGVGVFSGIPLGIAGAVLLYVLIAYYL